MTNNKQNGIVQAHMRGFGFVATEQGDRSFMPPPMLKKLLTDDAVEVTVVPGREPGTWQVGQASLVARKASVWMGTLKCLKGRWLLEPDDPCFVTIEVPSPPANYGENDVVCVATPALTPPTPLSLESVPSVLSGTVVQSLGARSGEGFEQAYALAKYQFPDSFSAEVDQECALLAQTALTGFALQGRTDLRNLAFVTIDSATTQDFDDALYAEPNAQGWRVLVAIADVAHYVKPGTPLDRCAKERGTSVYLPGKTVPMLPKTLSAGLCALQARQERYAVVMELQLDGQGQVLSARTHRALIQVRENLTYDWVYAHMNGARTGAAEVSACVEALQSVYTTRLVQEPPALTPGPESAEPVWVRDTEGQYQIEWVQRNAAHKLVENFMLLANQQVAKVLAQSALTQFFRHQAEPSALKWEALVQWAQSLGLPLPAAPSRSALAELARATPTDSHLQAQLQIRSVMSSASYHDEDPSHFSLGYETYTHFTSPIRRYADLVVHRLLAGDSFEVPELANLAQHCSYRSRCAKFAERYVWDKIKKRTLVKEAPALPLQAYVVTQSRFGVRAVVMPWQCIVNISGTALSEKGFSFEDEAQVWKHGSGVALEQGDYVSVSAFELEEYRAKTEVHAGLRAVPGLPTSTNRAQALGILAPAKLMPA